MKRTQNIADSPVNRWRGGTFQGRCSPATKAAHVRRIAPAGPMSAGAIRPSARLTGAIRPSFSIGFLGGQPWTKIGAFASLKKTSKKRQKSHSVLFPLAFPLFQTIQRQNTSLRHGVCTECLGESVAVGVFPNFHHQD